MTKRAPLLFIGHGSPMNAVADNGYTRALEALGKRLERPRALLCVSAHWTAPGLRLGAAASPRLVYDFYGFPEELYRLSWPAPGDPESARRAAGLLADFQPGLDGSRGLDHGVWSPLRRVFPGAEVPVFQLSLDPERPAAEHLAIAAALAPLRDEGILVAGSGNVVHNLGEVSWGGEAPPPDWALSFDEAMAAALAGRDLGAIAEAVEASRAGGLRAHPTVEHLLPLLYSAALAAEGEEPDIVHEGFQNGSISMRTVGWGL